MTRPRRCEALSRIGSPVLDRIDQTEQRNGKTRMTIAIFLIAAVLTILIIDALTAIP